MGAAAPQVCVPPRCVCVCAPLPPGGCCPPPPKVGADPRVGVVPQVWVWVLPPQVRVCACVYKCGCVCVCRTCPALVAHLAN